MNDERDEDEASADELEGEATDPSIPAVLDMAGAPPKLAPLSEVEPFQPPFEPPPGALRPPPSAPVWASDGEHTGRLVVPEDRRPVAPTKEMELSAGARVDAALATGEIALPSSTPGGEGASSLEPTAVLREDQPNAERTAVLGEAQLGGDAPAPLARDAKPPAASLFDEPTVLLPGRASAAIAALGEELDEPTQPGVILSAALVLDERDDEHGGGTQVLSGDELVELDDLE